MIQRFRTTSLCSRAKAQLRREPAQHGRMLLQKAQDQTRRRPALRPLWRPTKRPVSKLKRFVWLWRRCERPMSRNSTSRPSPPTAAPNRCSSTRRWLSVKWRGCSRTRITSAWSPSGSSWSIWRNCTWSVSTKTMKCSSTSWCCGPATRATRSSSSSGRTSTVSSRGRKTTCCLSRLRRRTATLTTTPGRLCSKNSFPGAEALASESPKLKVHFISKRKARKPGSGSTLCCAPRAFTTVPRASRRRNRPRIWSAWPHSTSTKSTRPSRGAKSSRRPPTLGSPLNIRNCSRDLQSSSSTCAPKTNRLWPDGLWASGSPSTDGR